MPDQNVHIRSPFKFLDPYDRADGNIFFGREQEVETLYQYVNKNRLVLLYGQSGTGKTSVLRCGLANRFEVTDWMPFFIRRGKNINDSLLLTISESKALGGREVTPENLLNKLNRISIRYVRPVFLIFDQFEELLILGTDQEKADFIKTIKNIIESDLTQSCSLLFILREEYFASLDVFERAIPHFSDRRLRIEPMSAGKVEEVITKSCSQFQMSFEDPVNSPLQIIESLQSKGGISLPYLQVYLDMLWREDFVRTYPNGWSGEGFPSLDITTQEIEDFGKITDVLERYMVERIEAIQRDLQIQEKDIDPDMVNKVLDAFVTEDGTKRPVSFQWANKQVKVSENAPASLQAIDAVLLTECLQLLEQSRILRADEDTYELAHDSLAILIDQNRSNEQQHLNDVFRQIRNGYHVHNQTGEYLTHKQLLAYEDYIPQLGLNADLDRFVKDSWIVREKEENEKYEAERRKRKRATWIAIGGIALALMSLIAGCFALSQTKIAKEEKQNAEREEAKSDSLFYVATIAAIEADSARLEAVSAKFMADSARLDADTARVLAEQAQLQAQQKAREAIKAKEETQALIDKIKSFKTVLYDVLDMADEHMLQLDYASALDKSFVAYNLAEDQEKHDVIKRMQEIAFVYYETGNPETADSVLELLDLDSELSSDSGIIAMIRNLNPVHFDTLRNRYYPEMVAVEGGSFIMGRDTANLPDSMKTWYSHKVILDDFEIAKTETTTWAYSLFLMSRGKEPFLMKKVRTSGGDGKLHEIKEVIGNLPQSLVCWYDAILYANWLSEKQNLQPIYLIDSVNQSALDTNENDPYKWMIQLNALANGYRLPTEAEWEYAASGGTKSGGFRYSGSDSLDLVGWIWQNSGDSYLPDSIPYRMKTMTANNCRMHPVAQKQPNELGIYDMSGNAWEWCWDWIDHVYYRYSPVKNPKGPRVGGYRSLRGSSFINTELHARNSYRIGSQGNPHGLNRFVGFRLVRSK